MDANATTLVQFSIKSYRNCSDRANRIQWNTMIQWWLDQARARYYLFLLFEYPGLARRPLLLFSERSITPSTANIVLMKWRETASKYCSAWRVTPRETSLQLSLSWRTSKRVSSFTGDAALSWSRRRTHWRSTAWRTSSSSRRRNLGQYHSWERPTSHRLLHSL